MVNIINQYKILSNKSIMSVGLRDLIYLSQYRRVLIMIIFSLALVSSSLYIFVSDGSDSNILDGELVSGDEKQYNDYARNIKE